VQPDELTEDLFAQHLNTTFSIPFDTRNVELELVDVLGDKSTMEKVAGLERFSIYFTGPGDFYLPQRMYGMKHEALGDLDLFIVPIGTEDKRYRYEAVFTRITDDKS
jgi:hypothetical protein